MTIYGNDKPDFIAQALKTDESLEGPEKSSKMMLSIINNSDETELLFSKENVDEKFFELMCEFLYGRAKMNLMDSENSIEDLHTKSVAKVVNVVNEMPIKDFNPEDARKLLNGSRGRGE